MVVVCSCSDGRIYLDSCIRYCPDSISGCYIERRNKCSYRAITQRFKNFFSHLYTFASSLIIDISEFCSIGNMECVHPRSEVIPTVERNLYITRFSLEESYENSVFFESFWDNTSNDRSIELIGITDHLHRYASPRIRLNIIETEYDELLVREVISCLYARNTELIASNRHHRLVISHVSTDESNEIAPSKKYS